MKKHQHASDSTSPDLFASPWLNRLTRTHVAIPVTLFLAYAAGLLYYTHRATTLPLPLVLGLFVGGMLLFTLVEYVIHRWVYHPHEGASAAFVKFTDTVHGVHHDHPKDKQRLAMPPVLSVVVGTLLLGIFRLLLGQYAFASLAGFMVGYALYLLIHFSVHIFRKPHNVFGALWTNHALHHYGDPNTMYGVSSPLWDHVFGTLYKKQAGDRPRHIAR
ncbi:MAG: sterol desaturase family protein [Lewinella sp.]|nr:sterol desaturase family protein [Lewinella sp.]